jgi:hypothetical protein
MKNKPETKLDNKIPHRDRKNPNSRENYRAQKQMQNATRGKQVWNGKEWVRP